MDYIVTALRASLGLIVAFDGEVYTVVWDIHHGFR